MEERIRLKEKRRCGGGLIHTHLRMVHLTCSLFFTTPDDPVLQFNHSLFTTVDDPVSL